MIHSRYDKSCTIIIEGVDARIEGLVPWSVVIDATSYTSPGYQFSPRFKAGHWDGRVKLFRQSRRTFPSGLVQDVKEALEAVYIRVHVDDKRRMPPLPDITESWEQALKLEGVSFAPPYDFQPEVAKAMLKAQRGIVAVATNGGKTEVSCIVTAALKLPTLFLVPGKDLLYQTQARFQKRLRLNDRSVGLVGDGKWAPGDWITIGTVQTLSGALASARGTKLLNQIQLILIDECFPAGTSVDGRPIESIQVGDFVTTFDEKSGKFSKGTVRRLIKSRPLGLLARIRFSGQDIICTSGHPFWTQRGWIPAALLSCNDKVLYAKKLTSEIGSDERQSSWIDIEDVEIAQQSNDGTFGGMCPDGFVYNLEVDPKHTYLANDFVVHNCHHTGSDTWYQVLRACNAFFRFGLSGTPLKRSDGADMRLLGATGPVIAEIRNKELISRGISSKVTIRFVRVEKPELPDGTPYPDVYRLGIVENPYRTRQLCKIVESFVEQKQKVLVLVQEILHGSKFNEGLWNYCKFTPSQFICGKESSDTRRKALDDFQSGNLPVLIATSILDEGVDMPGIDVLVLAGGGKSSIKTLQRIGRGIRIGGSSDRLTVIDTADFQNPQYLLKHSMQRMQDYRSEDCFEIEVTE